MEARNASGSVPHFTQSLYRGTVGLGSGVGTAIKDAADPSQPLRIRAQDPEFPVGTAWSFGLPGLLLGGVVGARVEWFAEQPGLRTNWSHV